MIKLDMIYNKFFPIILSILFFIQSYFYISHINNDYKLINEYRYMDEITLLNGKEVLNSKYIDENLLFNPKEKKRFTSTNNIFFYDKKNLGLSFNNIIDSFVLERHKLKSYNSLINKYNSHFKNIKYSKDLNMLYFDYMNQDNNFKNGKFYLYKNSLENYFSSYPMFQANSISKLKEQMSFIYSNIYEQNMQIFDRYYFHENSFMLSPLNEIKLGRDKSKIFSQYGYLSISIIDKIMNFYGGFSINNYEKAKKTIDQLYYLLAILFIVLFFKNNYLRVGFILFLGISLFGNKYYAFSYAPTVTNSRHLLDLLIIFSLYKYNQTKNNFYIVTSIFISILSIFIAKDFGQFIFLSIIGTLIIPLIVEFIKEKSLNKQNIFILLFTIIGGLLAFKYYPMGSNPSVKYFLDGFYSFPFSNNIIFLIVLFIIFIQWLLLLILYDDLKDKKYLYPYIFTILYTQFLYTYFIWHGSINNIVMYSYIFSLPFMMTYNINKNRNKNKISIFIVLVLFLIYIKLLNSFIIEKEQYNNIFKTHKLYKWNHPRAGGIISTYSFDKFQNSIDLIHKYSKKDKTYMISKYDNILGILSKKYSGFPFFELRSSIVTKDEFNMIKKQIKEEANILYVDNDIERNFKSEMKKMSFFDLDKFWRNESLKQRIPKLENLKHIWIDIKNNYNLVEKGKLISVYRKIKQ